MSTVCKWDVYEYTLKGPSEGNPFIDQQIRAVFSNVNETVTVEGFYDGDGQYRVRFMPSFEGEYQFSVEASFLPHHIEEKLYVTSNRQENHGPVCIHGTHFAYADGTPYYPIGTTCYAWVHQKNEMVQQTLRTLAQSPFNKIRFCIFPKHYLYNLHEPQTYPYEGRPCSMDGYDFNVSGMAVQPDNEWDFTRFNPLHFRRLEQAIVELDKLNIIADVIVMHPYDRWGFSMMNREQDTLYWRYVISRFAAYRNVWWSLANEWDLLGKKTANDWEHYADLLVKHDPYRRPRSIHNCMQFYDHNRPWVTHASIQRQERYLCSEFVDLYRNKYNKPIVLDEICYEGNIEPYWGNISGKELTRRFWEAVVRGGYPGHGETFDSHDGMLWWSHGGTLKGESPARIAFLRRILEETPGCGLNPITMGWDEVVACAANQDEYYLFYFGLSCPNVRTFHFAPEKHYRVEVIDTWEMTIKDMGVHSGEFRISMPGKEYIAVRIRACEPETGGTE